MECVRILILTASIGAGHARAAEAIHAALYRLSMEQHTAMQISTVDFMARDVSFIHYLMKRIYLIMLRFVPNLYDVFFRLAGRTGSGGMIRGAFSHIMVRTMGCIVRDYRPDLIIATHPFPEGAAALWRRKHGGTFRLSALLTDYSLHQIWLSRGVDAYFVATEQMREQMAAFGFDCERVYATGIPITLPAVGMMSRDAARRRIGLPEHLPTLLLMGGGLGLGGIEQTLAALETIHTRLAILVVAGYNAALLEAAQHMSETSHHSIRVWGYTTEVDVLMYASDILITKPGALTISEAFAAGLPLLLHDPIPGPETENAVYATRCGAAVWLHPGEKLAPAVEEILAHRLARMRIAARSCAKVDAAERIAEILAVQIAGKRGDANVTAETL